MFTAEINNIDKDSQFTDCPYVVVRLVKGEFWYWGAFAEEKRAKAVAEALENSAVFKYAENI